MGSLTKEMTGRKKGEGRGSALVNIRRKALLSSVSLGGQDQSLGIKDTLSIGPLDTH